MLPSSICCAPSSSARTSGRPSSLIAFRVCTAIAASISARFSATRSPNAERSHCCAGRRANVTRSRKFEARRRTRFSFLRWALRTSGRCYSNPVSETATAEAAMKAAGGWAPHDYTPPGLAVVRPDACFPHMQPGDPLRHPWKYLRRDVPHSWYADQRYPLMGFLNRDEAALLHNLALRFAGKRALEIGSWLGWSTAHLALAGVTLDVIDPAHEDPAIHASVEDSLSRCGVRERVRLHRGRSPESIAQLGQTWSLFFIDGDHEAPSPLRDTIAALPHATHDCGFVFHDLAAPAVADALRFLRGKGFHTIVYQTAQIMGFAWRGNVVPVPHTPDPEVAWQIPEHLSDLCGRPVRTAAYKELRHQNYSGEPSRPAVCIVTSELIGPFKNGGGGTATTGVAECLAADGLPVTVLYTGTIWQPHIALTPCIRHYAARGIELESLSLDDM